MARRRDAKGCYPTQTLRVFKIDRHMRGKVYTYARVTLEGGPLQDLGLRPGHPVIIKYRNGVIRIRPERSCSLPGCGRAHVARGYCGTHYVASRRAEAKSKSLARKKK